MTRGGLVMAGVHLHACVVWSWQANTFTPVWSGRGRRAPSRLCVLVMAGVHLHACVVWSWRGLVTDPDDHVPQTGVAEMQSETCPEASSS